VPISAVFLKNTNALVIFFVITLNGFSGFSVSGRFQSVTLLARKSFPLFRSPFSSGGSRNIRCPSGIAGLGEREPEAQAVVPVARCARIAVRCPHVPGEVAPAAAAEHAGRTSRGHHGVIAGML